MGIVQKDAIRTTILSYAGIVLGYLNKGVLFLLILDTEQIGLINLLFTVGLLFAQMANFGTVFTTWKFLPYFKNEARNHHGFLPLMLLIAACGVLFWTLVYWVFQADFQSYYAQESPQFNRYYFWVLPIGIGYVFFLVIEAYLKGFYQNVISVFAYEIGLRLGLLVSLIFLYVQWIDFEQFLYLHSIIFLLPLVVVVVYLLQTHSISLHPKWIQMPRRFKWIILQYSSFNYLNTLGNTVVYSLDAIMIAAMLGTMETGVYTTIVFLTSAVMVPYRSLIRIGSPLIADYWKERNIPKMEELYKRVSSVTLSIGLACFLLLWMNRDFLLQLLPADKRAVFEPGKYVFLFVMIGRLMDMYGGLNGSIFGSSKKYRYDLLFTIILIALVWLLNLWLIPTWGMIGAAISTGLAYVGYNLGRMIFVYYSLGIHPFNRQQLYLFLLAFLTLTIGWLVESIQLGYLMNLIVQCSIFLLCFVLPIWYFKLEENSVQFIQNFVAKWRNKI